MHTSTKWFKIILNTNVIIIKLCLSRYIRETGFNNGDRNDVPNILVIFTDGSSNNQQLTMEQSDLAKRAGIHIITVGRWLLFY